MTVAADCLAHATRWTPPGFEPYARFVGETGALCVVGLTHTTADGSVEHGVVVPYSAVEVRRAFFRLCCAVALVAQADAERAAEERATANRSGAW